jgi:cytidyltransferase-like protein
MRDDESVNVVAGAFDDLRLQDFRFLDAAAQRAGGPVVVELWSDDAVRAATGQPPKFPAAERKYLLEAIRFVERVNVIDEPHESTVRFGDGEHGRIPPARPESDLRFGAGALGQVPPAPPVPVNPPGMKVLVTGCYDWFHSGHVAFFEECTAMGDLYVGVGSDATIGQLKGKGHPLFPEDQRRYIVSTCRHVKHAFVSTGTGWLDAEPELQKIRPQIYAVNEDGDKPAKREYCAKHGIEYRVLKRVPKSGLPARQSTALRGF